MNTASKRSQRGAGLIVVILVSAFMLVMATALITLTMTNVKISDNIRLQHMAFDAADAGFDAAWKSLNLDFSNSTSASFAGLYRSSYKGEEGLDDPLSPHYFRKLTDEEILADLADDPVNALFVDEPLPSDKRCSYSVFLVNDEAPGTVSRDDNDCLMICIGKGPRKTYKRLEILIEAGT